MPIARTYVHIDWMYFDAINSYSDSLAIMDIVIGLMKRYTSADYEID